MDKRMLIGLLDSGIGGISVLACAKKFIPNADYIYYADTDNVPYGTKTHGEIVGFVDNAFRCLIERGVDAIVIACNTATSIAVEEMREKYDLPIVGMEPALKPAVKRHPGGKILVCATPVTVAAEKLRTLISSLGVEPDLCAAPELVTYAEAGVFDKETICAYLEHITEDPLKYNAVVLGCTHFTYFRDSFAETFASAEIIDGNIGAIKRLSSLLGVELSVRREPCESGTVYLRSGREVTDKDELAAFRRCEERMSGYYDITL